MESETKPSSSHMIGALWRGSVHCIAYVTLTQTFCHGETTKIIFHIPKKPYIWIGLQHPPPPKKKGLLQYCQLPDKDSHDISRDIWKFSLYLIFFYIYSTISREIPIEFLWKPGGETLAYTYKRIICRMKNCQ